MGYHLLPGGDGEDSCQFDPILSGRTDSWKMRSGILSKTESEKGDSEGETMDPELGWKLRVMLIKEVGFRKEDEALDTCVREL